MAAPDRGVAVMGGFAYAAWKHFQPPKLPPGFASSNGRIEATDIDVATKLAGASSMSWSTKETLSKPVKSWPTWTRRRCRPSFGKRRPSRPLLLAWSMPPRAPRRRRESEKAANEATLAQQRANLDLAKKNLGRAEQIAKTPGAISQQNVDTYRATVYANEAAVNQRQGKYRGSRCCHLHGPSRYCCRASGRRRWDGNDRTRSGRHRRQHLEGRHAGRVQYRVAQPGEVLPGGGKVLNMIDLGDVYMTFFLPTDWAGRVKQGAEVRLVLDAAPQFVIPAKVTFVADVAQFTPKTVETAEERQKLTFRIKAHIDKELLKKYVRDVKTGLPGVAYVQLNPQAPWPANLEVKLPPP